MEVSHKMTCIKLHRLVGN